MGKAMRKHDVRKNEIIETALRLTEDTPFEEISVSDICEAVGISIGGFYHYFNRKSDLLVGFFTVADEYLAKEVFPYLTMDDPVESLKKFAHGWSIHVFEHGVDRAKVLNTIAPADYDHSKRPRPTKLMLTDLFQAGQDLGQIPKKFTADKLADMYLIGIRGVISDWARRDGPYSIVQAIDDFADFMLTFKL